MKKLFLLTLFFCGLKISYAQSGELDPSFGNNGIVTVPGEYVTSSVIQSDGKILATANNIILRYNSDGSVDNTFGINGLLTTGFSLASIAIQSNDKFVVAGNTPQAHGAPSPDLFIARFNADGSPDSTFNGNGQQITDFELNSDDVATSVAIQKDGKVVLTGQITFAGNTLILVRYNADGSLDNTFDGDGKLNTNIKVSIQGSRSALIQNDGKIIVATSVQNNIAVFRFNADGSPDNTFDGDGLKTIDFGYIGFAVGMAIQMDGKIFVTGFLEYVEPFETMDACFVRLNIDGSLDNSFSDDGRLVTDFGLNAVETASGVAIGNDGKILIGGSSSSQNENYSVLARYSSDGILDSTFNGDGIKSIQGMSEIINLIIFENKLHAVHYRAHLARYQLGSNVAVTSPANNSVFNNPATIDVTALANSDITITKVEFYNGSILLHTDNTSPYTFSWTNVPIGNYALTAKATDNTGNLIISQEVHVFVVKQQAPTITFKSPSDNASYVGSSTIILEGLADDAHEGGAISKVEFFNGNTLLATVTDSPYVFNWVAVPEGNYTLTAKATDNTGITASAIVHIMVSNTPPTVSLITPTNNAIYFGGGRNVYLNAAASDADGTINKVEFYNGSTLLYTATDTPYTFKWQHVPSGNYILTAKAIDNSDLVTTSAEVNISILPNTAPTISITNPANNRIYLRPGSIHIEAVALDPDGRITKVEFYNGTTLLKTDYQFPYSLSWTNVPLGNYVITAKATDNWGAVTTSAPVNVSVVPNKAPSVNIIGPANGESFTEHSTIKIEAAAQDPDGRIIKVEFYHGTTLLTTERKLPYSYQWGNVLAGTYTLTARATDNWGVVTTSAPVQITVIQTVQCPLEAEPTFGLNFNGSSVANINNDSSDPGEKASVTFCGAGQYTVSGHFHSSSSNLYYIVNATSGGTLHFDGSPVGNSVSVITAAQFTASGGTHFLAFSGSDTGTLTQTITPFTRTTTRKRCFGSMLITICIFIPL